MNEVRLAEDDSKPPQAPHISDFAEAAFRSMLPGVEYALKCLVQELNGLRERLGYGPVSVEGLGEGWGGRPKKSGITEEGRKKLRDMMKKRWEQAYKEGKHVTEIKPGKKTTGKKKPPQDHS